MLSLSCQSTWHWCCSCVFLEVVVLQEVEIVLAYVGGCVLEGRTSSRKYVLVSIVFGKTYVVDVEMSLGLKSTSLGFRLW